MSLDDIPLEIYDETSGFEFDGIRYASINSCIDYFTKSAGVDKELLLQLVDIVSSDRFSYALRIAKLNKSVFNIKRSEIVEEVIISGSIAPVFAIQ